MKGKRFTDQQIPDPRLVFRANLTVCQNLDMRL